MKKIGVLLAISSLPSDFGIGDLGANAYEFIDILKQSKVSVWQVLPLTPLGFGNSPYQSSSSFAGDEIYIAIDKLVEKGLLNDNDIETFNKDSISVDYENVRAHKNKLLEKAFKNFKKAQNQNAVLEYNSFVAENPWSKNYAVFKTFSKANDNNSWNTWQSAQKDWVKNQSISLDKYQQEIDYQLFLQYIFYTQWFELKSYANKNGIEIMGDLPIYAGFDSVDVWGHQDLFLLDNNQSPTHVAGVPPDFFSETGQLWGNPLYDWDKLEKTGFKFWIERLKGNFKLFDIVRIDHFRAFDTYWKIPADETTAINGEWVEAPGYKFFDTVYKELPNANIIAEDLGDLRQEVFELRDHYNLKGMKVFPFHFDATKKSNDDFDSVENMVVYTGTHDNNTLKGWYDDELNRWQRKLLKRHFKANDRNVVRKIISYCLACDANYVIVPIQDILELDSSARFNTPGQVGSPNWEWKLANFDGVRNNLEKVFK